MTTSSAVSSTLSIDWRPSRWLLAALCVLGLLAGLSLGLSDLGTLPATLAAAGSAAWTGSLVRKEARRPAGVVTIGQGITHLHLNGRGAPEPLHDLRWQLRGPLAVLLARDRQGQRICLSWWPDTLPPSSRRQLRLARDLGSRHDKPLPPVAA